jgi:hypothetical protein
LRGGSWNSLGGLVRSAFRNYYEPDYRYYSVGFRLALGQMTSTPQASSSESRRRGQASGSEAGQRRRHEAQGGQKKETKNLFHRLVDKLKPK